MSKHKCHAIGCPVRVHPKKLLCLFHWHMLPKEYRQSVRAHYRPGQEVDKRPTTEYCDAARAAIERIAKIEQRSVTGDEDEIRVFALVDPATNSRGDTA